MEILKQKILFATNWTGSLPDDCPLSLSNKILNQIALDSDNDIYCSKKGYEKFAFLDIFDHAIDGDYDFIIYSDADNFIVSEENLFLDMEDFAASGALFSGCSEGGQLAIRHHNPWSINPFLLFVNVSRLKSYRHENRKWFFGENKILTKEEIPYLTKNSYFDVVSAYQNWRKNKKEYQDKIFKSNIKDLRFQRYNDIFLGSQSTGNDSIRFMFACDFICPADTEGITSAVFHFSKGEKKNFADISKMISLHTWYSRVFLGKDKNREYHKRRIENVAGFAKQIFIEHHGNLIKDWYAI